MKYTDFVNVFQGTGEIDLPKPEGIAAKWFFIKAGCGNTSPAAVLPFGAVSVSPFSGGYPTGYGDHLPNSHSRPAHFEGGKDLIGFSHIHQSGTGAIGFYYNYAVTVPRYKSSPFRRTPENEYAYPGFYSCTVEDIDCELTVTRKTAFHRYSFGSPDGIVEIDFGNNGLFIPDWNRDKVSSLKLTCHDDHTVTAEAVIEGIEIFFAASSDAKLEIDDSKAYFTVNNSRICNLKLSVSLISTENALSELNISQDFDEIKEKAAEIWNEKLGKIRIETKNTDILEIFYSNLYHSFIKPSDWYGESFVYEKGKAFTSDFATLWDMYKTAIPLIFMTDKKMGEDIAETLLSFGEATGNLPNGFGLTNRYKEFSDQARVLGVYVLITAYRYNIIRDAKRLLNVIKSDIFSEDKKDFIENGRCISHTFVLDMADACLLTAEIAKEQNDLPLYEVLTGLGRQWKNVYSSETGLLLTDCPYYEGTNYNYSFRQMVEMDERIELAGGKEGFISLLDDFFGYGKEDTVQPTDPHNYAPVEEGMKLGRFEGFNNESDTETPFSYIYAHRHDRTCEVLRAGMKYMFTKGRGGIPGNNDSGALSSYYVFAALGIYPLAGHKLFLIGSPFVDKAEISLSSGKTLTVSVKNNTEENIYVKSVFFNKKEITDFRIEATELLCGGTLEFVMSNTP